FKLFATTRVKRGPGANAPVSATVNDTKNIDIYSIFTVYILYYLNNFKKCLTINVIKEVDMATKILIIYYSSTGNTEKMAYFIKTGAEEEGVDVKVKEVEKAGLEDMLDADGIIIGSPTYYGTMAAPIKEFLDKSVAIHSKLDGKVGAAFSSSANIGGGNETTIIDILNALLIHGMVIQGDPSGGHYGVVSIGAPDSRVERECKRLGKRIAKLVKKLHF
ncbi:MAG: NAD(P)H-dependent oxidoreductase, partial [Candidatus Omnitrophica bacterium]|nr:NAD(P)H-dependent oxidoreductase [Candidatus Omnitrophota bacterium]